MKLFMIIILTFTFSAGNVAAEDIKMFGLKTYENISKYSTSFATDSEPDSETLGGYNQIYIDPPRAHVAFEWYGVSYNIKTNLVEAVTASKEMFDIDFCTEQLDSWIPRIEKKFSVKLERYDNPSDNIHSIGGSQWFEDNSNFSSIDARCNQYDDGSVQIFLMWQTEDYVDAVNEFYNNF